MYMYDSSVIDEWDIPVDSEPGTTNTEIKPISIEECLAAGKDGIEISNEHYHALGGISGSNLSLLAESNKHLDNKNLFNPGETAPLNFGTLVHTLVLEPHDIEHNYAIMPGLDLRTNKGKFAKESFIEANEDKIIITQDDYDKATDMARNVMAICVDIIEKGVKERSYFVRDDELVLKIRPDCYDPKTGDEWDIKTITPKNMDMSDRALERHITNLGYHISAGYRNHVRKLLGLQTGNFNLIFVSTSPGHMVRNIRMASAWIEEAEYEVKDMLEGRKFYLGTGIDKGVSVIDRYSRKYD